MTTVALLRAAKQELLTRGWIQGLSQNAHGVCLQGAVLAVGGRVFSTALLQAYQTLAGCLPEAEGYNPVVYWNDTPGRTPEEVLALLDQAIARAAQDEAIPAPVRV
jgi:hypothetical protein